MGLVILKCEKIIWTSLSGWFAKMWDEIYCLHLNARVWKLVYQVPDKIRFWSMVLAYCEMYASVWVWTIMFERLFLRFFPLFLSASILLFTYLVVIRIWFQVTWAEGGILNQYASYKLDSGVQQTTLVNFQSIFSFGWYQFDVVQARIASFSKTSLIKAWGSLFQFSCKGMGLHIHEFYCACAKEVQKTIKMSTFLVVMFARGKDQKRMLP